MHGPALMENLRERRGAMLDSLRFLVEQETPSRDKVALDVLADHLATHLAEIGGTIERVANPIGGDHLVARFASLTHPDAAPGLILGHYDTVWPIGTTATRPFTIDGDKVLGPGTFDMKASLVMAAESLATIGRLGLVLPRPIVYLITSDEEIGSPASRLLIEATARGAAYALIIEPAMFNGDLKTARKGTGKFHLDVTGRSSHAGVEPEKGVNAILEMAHQVVRLHAMNDPATGTTVNVGVIAGGTTSNVVPALAHAEIDVRVTSMSEAARIEAAIHALKPVLPDAQLTISGEFDRPPLERTPAGAALFAKAKAVAATIGLDVGEGSTGGGSDGNLTSAVGTPTLDGLGPVGAGAHAEYEHVLIASMPERAALMVALLLEL